MKKRNVILILVLILIVVLSIIVYNIIINNEKQYEIEEIKEYNYFVLKQNNQYGVIDKKGNILINTQYDEVIIPNPSKAVFVCYKEDNVKVLNEKNEQILQGYAKIEPIRFKNISSSLMYEKSVLKYEQDGKYGLINFEGKELSKPIYDDIDSLQYKEGELLVKKDNKYGVINIKGKELIEIKYDQISIDEYYTDEANYRNAGYIVGIRTEEGYRYGYLDKKGKEVLKTEYNQISRVTQKLDDDDNAYLICSKNGQYGISKNNDVIIENEYQSIRYDESNKVFVIEKSKKYGIADIQGKIIVPVQYNQIDITGIYLYAQNEQGVTVYNSNGTQANIDSNIAILNTSNEKYKIRINNEQGSKYGVISPEGKQIIEEKYNYIKYLYDDYFIASYENGKLGILDNKENVKIELNNDVLQQIQGTDLIQATTSETQMTSLYSKNLEKICEMKSATTTVEKDYIKLYNDTQTKYFDKEGKELTNIDVYPNNKLFVKQEGDKYGYIDKQGNLVVECKYDKAYEFNEYGFASVKKDGKWGSINSNGEEVVSPIYEFSEHVEPIFIRRLL